MLYKKRRPAWVRVIREIYFFFERPCKKIYFWLFRPHTDGVKSFVFYDEKLLMVRLGYAHKKWVLPGGAVDRGEPLMAAAFRELVEESGVVPQSLEKIGSLYSEAQYKKNTVYYFFGESNAPDLEIDDQEIVDAGWFEVEALPDNCAPRVAEEIRLYNDWKYGS